MPWISGEAPVYIVPKQTGVTDGITLSRGRVISVLSITGVKRSAYFSKIQRAIASGLYIKILSTPLPSQSASKASKGLFAWFGFSIPKAEQREAATLVNLSEQKISCIKSPDKKYNTKNEGEQANKKQKYIYCKTETYMIYFCKDRYCHRVVNVYIKIKAFVYTSLGL